MSPEFKANMGRIGRLPTDDQRAFQQKGVEAAKEKAQRIKEWQETMKDKMVEYALMFLDAAMLPGIKKIYEQFNLPNDDATNMMAIFMGMGRRAQQGDATAAKFLFEVAGIFTETKNLNINGALPVQNGDLMLAPPKKEDEE